jgi:hypothetical protein
MFVSSIAFPDDVRRRNLYRNGLCRSAILRRAQIEKDWGRNPQWFKPNYFSQGDRSYKENMKCGARKLIYERLLCIFMITPHLGRKPRKLPGGLYGSVENAAMLATQIRGGKGEDGSTFESRYWRFTKPVLHGVTALAKYLTAADRFKREDPLWASDCPLLRSPMLAIMFYPEVLEFLLDVAEETRLRLPGMGSFHINEQDTIQFVGV